MYCVYLLLEMHQYWISLPIPIADYSEWYRPIPIVMCEFKFDVVAFVPVHGLRCSKTSALLHAHSVRCRAASQCSRSKISDHVKRVRRFQCQIFGSRAWFIFAASARAAKITRILRKQWRTGQRIWFSSESKIKDCFLNQRRWTCWFCLCCLSHVTLWRLSLNVLYLFDSLVFVKRSGVAYASPHLIRLC